MKPWLEIEKGPRLKLDKYTPKGKHPYRRWILECTHHDSCSRKRSVTLTSIHGDVEPIAFLVAWNRKGAHVSVEEHTRRNFPVTPEEVAREVVALGNRARPALDLL